MPKTRENSDPADTIMPLDELRKARDRASFVISLPKWAAYAIIAWQIRLSVEAMLGDNATPALLMRFGREVSYWEIVCWAAGALGVFFGLYSRRLLRRQLDKETLNTAILEKRLAVAAAAGRGSISVKPGSEPGT